MSMRTRSVKWLGAAAIAVSIGWSAPARAEVVLRPSVLGGATFLSGGAYGGGYATFSAGYNLELEPILVIPELAASFGGFGGDAKGFGARVMGGLRAGAALAVEPSLILRGGYGHASYLGGGSSFGANGGAVQVGTGLDYRVDRDFTVGGELIYDAFIAQGTTAHSILLGATFGFWL